MKRKMFAWAIFGSIAASAQVDSVLNHLKISGSVDGYFRTNLNTYNRYYQDDDADAIAPKTSFADKPGFALGMANVILNYEDKKVGAVVDLAFGPRANEALFNADAQHKVINQLYAYWKATDKLKLTMGQFNTFLGYEVISPTGNFNYSTSYMFSYGPFNHTGLKFDYQINDKWSAIFMVANPSDHTEFNDVGTYTLGGQLGYAVDGKKAYLNLLYGDQDGKLNADGNTLGDNSAGSTFQIDLTGGVDLTEKLYLGVNTTYTNTASGEAYTLAGIEDADTDAAGFWGAALYTQYKLAEKITLGLRSEYFSEYKGGVGGLGVYNTRGDAAVTAVTLTCNAQIGPLAIKPELRYDFASEAIFADKQDGSLQKNLGSFVLAAVYKF